MKKVPMNLRHLLRATLAASLVAMAGPGFSASIGSADPEPVIAGITSATNCVVKFFGSNLSGATISFMVGTTPYQALSVWLATDSSGGSATVDRTFAGSGNVWGRVIVNQINFPTTYYPPLNQAEAVLCTL